MGIMFKGNSIICNWIKLSCGSILSMVYRGGQIVLVLVNLAISIALVAVSFSEGRGIYIIVVSSLTLVYIVPLFIVSVLNVLTPGLLLATEFAMGVLWLIAFALITDEFSTPDDCFGQSGCKLGKSLIAFILVVWLSFVGSLLLLVILSVVPLVSTVSWLECFNSDGCKLQPGGLVLAQSVNRFEDFDDTIKVDASPAQPQLFSTQGDPADDDVEGPSVATNCLLVEA